MQAHHNLSLGDQVQLLDTDQIGKLMAVHQREATIQFEYITLKVPLQDIQPVATSPSIKQYNQQPTHTRKNLRSFKIHEFVNFKPELDLHGFNIHDAITALDKWIDQGCLAGHRHLRIIHGKGRGVLRQHVHQYLKTNELVSKIIDNHPFPGGSGVTYIEL